MTYRMNGRFLEACDCYVPCPCWFDNDPNEDECTGVVAWQIENGEIEGVDVTGLSVISVSQHGGLARMTGDLAAVETVKISFVADNDGARLDVPRRIAVRAKLLRGSTNRPITIGDGQLATLLGTPAVAGKSSR